MAPACHSASANGWQSSVAVPSAMLLAFDRPVKLSYSRTTSFPDILSGFSRGAGGAGPCVAVSGGTVESIAPASGPMRD